MNTSLPTPLRLYLIRHGETEWSLNHRHTGRTDIPLTQNGEDEARAIGEHLRDIWFAYVGLAEKSCNLYIKDLAADREPYRCTEIG